jgi:hypothetical protein
MSQSLLLQEGQGSASVSEPSISGGIEADTSCTLKGYFVQMSSKVPSTLGLTIGP